MGFSQKIKIELAYDPEIPLLGMYPKEVKSGSQRCLHPHVHCGLTHRGQDVGAAPCT